MGLSTLAGTLTGFLLKHIPHKYNDAILGSAAGFMLAASVLGLILPAAASEAPFALLQCCLGVAAGALTVSVLDIIVPHLHRLAGIESEKHPDRKGAGKILLFVAAIALHKIPEGLATGVSFGTGNLNDVMVVAGSISLQNIPEAIVIVAPLMAIGVSKKKTLLFSVSIALITITAVLIGYCIISLLHRFIPFVLSVAGGTMLYVVSDEMIPETHSHGHEKLATFSLIAGFMFTLIIQNISA